MDESGGEGDDRDADSVSPGLGTGGISLGRVTTLLVGSRAGGYALALLNSVVLARALGPDGLGVYAYAMGIAALFGLLPNLGISTIVTRNLAQDRTGGAGLVRAALRAQVVLAGGVILLIPLFAAALPSQPTPLGYVFLAGAQLGMGTLSWPYLAILAGRARYDRVALIEILAGIVGTLTVLLAVALRGDVVAFLWAHVTAAALSVVISRQLARPFLPVAGHTAVPFRDLLRQAAPFGASAVVQGVYTRQDIVLLGQLGAAAEVGLYSAAYKPVNLAVSFGSTVAGPLFPLMAQRGQRDVPIAFARAMRGLGAGAPAVALAVTGLAALVLRGLFGGPYAAASVILMVLIWSATANWLYAPLGIALQARGHERAWMVCLIVGAVVNGMINLWAIPRWGGLGAATATLVSESTLLVLGVYLAWRKLAIRPTARPVLTGLGATCAGALALVVFSRLGDLVATGAALFVYAGLLVSGRVITRADLTIVMDWIRQATQREESA
jgi:lipopolysaccharide exporter